MTSDFSPAHNFSGLGLVARSNYIYPNYVIAVITFLYIKLVNVILYLIKTNNTNKIYYNYSFLLF